ncbi:ATP-binding protein [Jatrophihabitans fulvus]
MGSLRVRHDATSAGEVRRKIAADLAARSVTPDAIDDVVLVASELVGNAVTHAAEHGSLDVAWQLEDSTVIVRVRDGSSEQPHVRTVPETSPNGRGLAIVAAVAVEWGVQPLTDGKQVWARVPVRYAV